MVESYGELIVRIIIGALGFYVGYNFWKKKTIVKDIEQKTHIIKMSKTYKGGILR